MAIKEKRSSSLGTALHVMFHLTGLIPLLFAVTYLLLALAAAAQVGHWPSYGQPDPKAVNGLAWLQPLVVSSLAMSVAAIPIWLVTNLSGYVLAAPWRPRRWQLLLYLAGILLALGLIGLDSAQGGWIAD